MKLLLCVERVLRPCVLVLALFVSVGGCVEEKQTEVKASRCERTADETRKRLLSQYGTTDVNKIIDQAMEAPSDSYNDDYTNYATPTYQGDEHKGQEICSQ